MLTLAKNLNEDTQEVVRCLMAERGKLKGLMVYYRDEEGHEDAIFTGLYRERPAEALMAAMKVSVHLTKLEEPSRGKP